MFAGCPSLSPWSCWLSFAVSHGCSLSLTVSLVPCRFYMYITVSHFRWLSLNVSSIAMGLLHVSHCFLWLLAFSKCLLQCHRVASIHSLSLIVAGFFSLSFRSRSHGIDGFLSLSTKVASFLLTASFRVAAILSLSHIVACCF